MSVDDLVVLRGRARLLVVAVLSVFTVALAVAGYLGGAYTTVIVYEALLVLAAVLGYNLFSGATGYLSFAHGMLYGVGGYAAIIAAKLLYPALGPASIPLAIVAAGAVSALVAAATLGPLLRVRGAYFAVSSLALFLAAAALVSSIPGLGGSEGLNAPAGAGLSPGAALAAATLLALTAIAASYLMASTMVGRRVLAVRDSEEAAQSLGLNPVPYRLLALAASGFVVGAAGAIFFLAYGGRGHVEPELAFDPKTNTLLVLAALAGGLGSLTGCYAAALILFLLDSFLTANASAIGSLVGLSSIQVRAIPFLVFGGLVAALAIVSPRGLYGLFEEHASLFKRLAAAGRGAALAGRRGEGAKEALRGS